MIETLLIVVKTTYEEPCNKLLSFLTNINLNLNKYIFCNFVKSSKRAQIV